MRVGLVVYAIPFFFALIVVEVSIARLMGRSVYRLSDSLNDISTGILQLLTGNFFRVVIAGGYVALYQNWHWLDIGWSSGWGWLALWLGVDFFYYWFHRISHEWRAPWAAHVVHHQSEEYNLSVALRQGAFQSFFSWVFYLPLAIVGFPPSMFFVMAAANTVYQFWIHTRLIDRLGPLEWVINTPSHHRVHHARNVEYLDKNYGGSLIIWDRIFGTYAREAHEPTYGITKPLRSWNPIWANIQSWQDNWRDAVKAKRVWDKIRLLVMPPGWVPEGVTPQKMAPLDVKFDTPTPAILGRYALAHYVVIVSVVLVLVHRFSYMDQGERLLYAGWILASVTACGGIFEGRRWARTLEIVRLLAIPALVFCITQDPLPNGVVAAAALISAMGWGILSAGQKDHFQMALGGVNPPSAASPENARLPDSGAAPVGDRGVTANL
jgi:sterol desaturase/sphingolipid hydroxylase (fatty acid hydroxylase superfamily)